MRLIATIQNSQDAYVIVTALQHEGIGITFEETPQGTQIWIENEDDLERAKAIAQEYEGNPGAARFANARAKPRVQQIDPQQPKAVPIPRKKPVITKLIIGFCIVLFFWTWMQEVTDIKEGEVKRPKFEFTEIASIMLYDYPKTFELMRTFLEKYPISERKDIAALPPAGKALFTAAEKTPYWEGIYQWFLSYPKPDPSLSAPMFEKIREGQVWRLISPVFMHGNIIHILFNMLWLWLLGKMVEERMKPMRYLVLMLILGVVSNTAQYLMSGPFFIGYSGIITGLAGFIWMRQRKAPWEGYPLPRSTLIFLMIFIFGMGALGVMSFIFERLGHSFFAMNLANTAHITGMLLGAGLARVPYFARRRKA